MGSAERPAPAPTATLLAGLALLTVACGAEVTAGAPEARGTLHLSVRAHASGRVTPARVELRDARGGYHVPEASLRVAGACSAPAPAWWTEAALDRAPPTGVAGADGVATHFYVARPIEADLPPGRYVVTAYKGNEYLVASAEVEVRAGERTALTLEPSRWVDLPAEGWFSGDAHIHVTRPSRALDRVIADWMRAEDVHVASLLQSGTHGGRIESAPQFAFGPDAVYQDGNTIVASGQENPRTWILGHGIVLGGDAYLDSADDYLAYDRVWGAAREQGALLGYAHFHAAGLLLDAPERFVDFLEVLQFDVANYDSLYELWDLGLRVSPFAGTDHPCPPSGVPGSQRLYARVEGALTYERWLEAVRLGRTFVTNGPVLDLTVDGVGIGGEVRLEGPGVVRVRARVRFDPARDDVRSLELVRSGGLVALGAPAGPGVIALDTDVHLGETAWLAARAHGTKVAPAGPTGRVRDSLAHTASVRAVVHGTPGLAAQVRAGDLAGVLSRRLRRLERRVGDDVAATGALPEPLTGVTPEVLRTGQAHLLARIVAARTYYARVAREASRRGAE